MIDYRAIRNTTVVRQPFKFFATPGVLSPVDLATIEVDFPMIRKPGIFPLSELTYGPAFAALIDDICSFELQDIMSEKFALDLSDRPLMITVRGKARLKDGRIHTDTESKVVTCLLYLNDIWDESGGQLRMLRGSRRSGRFPCRNSSQWRHACCVPALRKLLARPRTL